MRLEWREHEKLAEESREHEKMAQASVKVDSGCLGQRHGGQVHAEAAVALMDRS
jgi:hypothetical protein